MLPELVLNKEEKKERFRKCIDNKKLKSDMEEAEADEVVPEASLPTERIKEEVDNSKPDHQMDRKPTAADPPRIESLVSTLCYFKTTCLFNIQLKHILLLVFYNL